MNVQITKQLLQKLGESADNEWALKAVLLLRDPNAHLVHDSPSRESIQELLPTLRMRLQLTARTRKEIFGLRELIRRLEKLDANLVVLGYGLISDKAAGNIYITDENLADDRTQVLGAMIVDR